MEQQTSIAAQIAHADTLLKEGDVRGAAEEYASIARSEPNNVAGHLGLAEASLALGDFATTQQACNMVQQLQPQSAEAALARAILAVINQRFDLALPEVEHSIELDPTRGYAHALRAFVLRRLGQRYDGALAEARAGRTWGTTDLDHLFASIPANTVAPPTVAAGTELAPQIPTTPGPRPWTERSAAERRMVQTRFVFRNTPVATYTLMAINIAIFIIWPVLGNVALYNFGASEGSLIAHDPVQVYRIITSMFLHESLIHIGSNMLSLFFVGIIVERIFGTGRFTIIYFASGIVAGITQAIIVPNIPSIGASGAIAGIFGAFGAFLLLRRRSLGPAGNSLIGQWLFWLGINAYLSISDPNIAGWAHLGGLIAGFVIGLLLTMRATRQPRRAY